MDNISKQDLFQSILASGILTAYAEQDASLAELLKSANHPDIHYFDAFAIANQLTPVFKKRLGMMKAKKIEHNFDAIQELLIFTQQHPDSQIYNITFNCPSQHYGVRCGVVGQELHPVCVMIGAHIPNEILGENTE